MNPTAALAPLVVVAAFILWAYVDARRHQAQGREVVAPIGSVQIDQPQRWVAGCVVLFIVTFPLYLLARGERNAN